MIWYNKNQSKYFPLCPQPLTKSRSLSCHQGNRMLTDYWNLIFTNRMKLHPATILVLLTSIIVLFTLWNLDARNTKHTYHF